MSRSIKMSPKHGLNPTITICYWCGEDTGVAMLGRINKADDEAPRHIVAGYEPCDECRKKFEDKVVFIEVTEEQDNLPQIGKNEHDEPVYPTNHWIAVSKKYFNEDVPQKALVDKELFAQILKDFGVEDKFYKHNE